MNGMQIVYNFLNVDFTKFQSIHYENQLNKEELYLLALDILSKDNEWIKNKPLTEKIIEKLSQFEPVSDEACKKTVAIYQKILSKDPKLLQNKEFATIKLPGNHFLEIPVKLLMAESHIFYELLENNVNSTLDFSETGSLEALKFIFSYLLTGKIEAVPREVVLELLMLANRYKLTELAEKCLEHAFLAEFPDDTILSNNEQELKNLIEKAKLNHISIENGIIELKKSKSANAEEQYLILSELHQIAPIKHLKVGEEFDFNGLLSFVQQNPDLESLDLSKTYIYDPDSKLAALAPHLTHLKSLSISSKELNKIPRSICSQLRELNCSNCTSLIKLNLPQATYLNCNNCPYLIKLKIPCVEELHCQACEAISDLDAPAALKIDCSRCLYIETIDAPNATYVDCSYNYYIKTLDAPSLIDLNCSHCKKLRNLLTPQLLYLNCSNCSSITTLDARLFLSLDCSHCPKLRSLEANNATIIDCSYCSELQILEADAAQKVRCTYCTNLSLLKIDMVLILDCSHCSNLGIIQALSAKEVIASNCNMVQKINTPAATLVNCNECSSLENLAAENVITLNAVSCISLKNAFLPNAEYVNCRDCVSLESIDAHKVKELICNDCRALKSIFTPLANNVNCCDCENLETLTAPTAQILINYCPSLTSITIDEIELVSLDRSKYPKLVLTQDQKDFIDYFKSLEINPDAYQMSVSTETPPAPKLSLDYRWEPENTAVILDQMMNEFNFIIDNIDVQNPRALYAHEEGIKNGGTIYSKEQLKEGLQKLASLIQSEDTPEETKHQLFLLLEAIFDDQIGNNPLENNYRIIRLSVAGLEDGDTKLLENDLQLLYSLNKLTRLFDSINFTQKEAAGYFDPALLKDDSDVPISVDKIRKGLINIFDHVINRKGAIGTPPENPQDNHAQLRLYYNNLGLFLNHIALNLEHAEDLEEAGRHLIDLGIAGNHCGERWIGDAEQLFGFTSKNEQLTIPDHIFAQDTKMRTGIIEQLSTHQNVINVHIYNQYKRLIGMEFGIPGSGALVGLVDFFQDPFLIEEIARNDFLNAYAARVDLLLKNQKDFLDALYKNPKTRDNFMEFIKETMPESWVDTHYGPILDTIKKMEVNGDPREAIRQKLNNEGYWIRPDWNAQAALKRHLSLKEQQYKNTRPSKLDSPIEYELHEHNFAQTKKELDELKKQLENLTIEEQKQLLKSKNIELGREINPDFTNELRLTVIAPEYLETLMMKDISGYPTNKLTYRAIAQILEYVGKIRVKNGL